MKLLNYCNKIIEYSFYLLLFMVPLALTGDTSELFEFNKLWVTFILTIVIGTAWAVKMVVKKEFRVQRTPLDIPIALFVLSQVFSTIFSIDQHVSLWGYYSRFNGGLFSILSYLFLYYAFVSNLKDIKEDYKNELKSSSFILFIIGIVIFFAGAFLASQITKIPNSGLIPFQLIVSMLGILASFTVFMKAAPQGILKKSLYAILASSVLVVLWGLPSHFGFDPTCYLFRGTLDVSCWTADFLPKIRVFSTLGQPDWLAAYLVILVPIMIGILLNFVTGNKIWEKGNNFFKNINLHFSILLITFIGISYLMILYTLSRSAVLAIWLTFIGLIIYYFWFFLRPKFDKSKLSLNFKLTLSLVVLITAITFLNGQPFSILNIFTLKGIQGQLQSGVKNTAPAKTPAQQVVNSGELGGTDSGKIRIHVWQGAINIWKHYPIFGSGVETFGFSYYQFRPINHNLTSEWNYLYNKAHNEYLNYLATTGTIGIATYLLMIGSFLFLSLKFLLKNLKNPSKKDLLIVSMLAGYGGILITNFFGFSVVMVNILFYLIPAFVLMLCGLIDYDKSYKFSFTKDKKEIYVLSKPQIGLSIISLLLGGYLIIVLINFWNADRYYYYGFNFDRSGDYQKAQTYLTEAVNKRPSEPVFRDELALNNAILASAIIYQNQAKPDQQSIAIAKQFLDNAISNSNRLISEHPNNIVFLKSRVRLFYTLSQVDPSYLPIALDTIKKAQILAPTDADVSYNLGVLYGQTGDLKKGISVLENTVKLKPDYQGGNAYYALGIFYHQLALDNNGKVVNQDYAKKAIEKMEYIINTFGPNAQAQTALDTWNK